MKSLNTEINKLPSTFLVKASWSNQLNKYNGKPTDEDHLYYILLRAVVAKYTDSNIEIAERLKRAFPPVTNTTKRYNGRRQYDTLNNLLARLNNPYSIYSKTPQLGVDAFTHKLVKELAAKVKVYV